MRHLETVEDYIAELFEGSNVFHKAYRLATYDNRIVQSIYHQVTFQNVGLSDKQAELCIKLIEKYTRQLRKSGIDNYHILDTATRKFRLPVRKIDRTTSLTIKNNLIEAKFPYNIKIIGSIRQAGQRLAGSASWDSNKKIWQFDLTEPFVIFSVDLCKEYNFDIDPKLIKLYDEIKSSDWDKHDIKLIENNGKYVVQNAPQSLREYIDKNIGNDLIKLVDNSSICAYKVDNNVEVQIKQAHTETISRCLLNRHIWLDPRQYSFASIIEYAELTNRFPITIYDTLGDWRTDNNFSHIRHRFLNLYERFGPLYHHDTTLPDDWPYRNADPLTAKIKIYKTACADILTGDIPLFITTQNFNYGSLRMRLLAKAEKIVYHCTKL